MAKKYKVTIQGVDGMDVTIESDDFDRLAMFIKDLKDSQIDTRHYYNSINSSDE